LLNPFQSKATHYFDNVNYKYKEIKLYSLNTSVGDELKQFFNYNYGN
jgi:hypothetical protein